MFLDRHYRKPQGWKPIRNERGLDGKLKDPARQEGELLNPPPIDHVTVKHTGVAAEQNFSDRLINAGLADGWISIGNGKLSIKTDADPLVYTILRGPGHYCCHCGEKLIDANGVVSPGTTRGQQHVKSAHGDAKSPDSSNPFGYRLLKGYECVIDAKQHEKFRARNKRGDVIPNRKEAANG